MNLSATTLQRLIAVPFITLGGWALVAPQSVLDLAVRPEMQVTGPLAPLLMGCFGAQAVLCSIFILTSRFTRYSFAVYGVALLPFFWFNYHFYFVQPVINAVMAVDCIGNIIMLILCILGWKTAVAEGR